MPPKQKSIFRRPEAQHFQLVHRSQRDPLIHAPDATPHILKPFKRENDIKKGKTRADLESYLPNIDKERDNIGEAAEHGIYFDDTDYDYMQHLRDPNVGEEGMETILIPSSSKTQGTKSRSDPFELKLPLDVLPPTSELNSSKALDAQRNIQDDIAGFKPDMDPHLRQVLQALGEDAFIDDSLEDDFFGELVKQGEREEGDGVDFEFYEDGEEAQKNDSEGSEDKVEGEESWEARFIKFKKQQQRQKMMSGEDRDEDDEGSSAPDIDTESQAETIDTIGKLPVIGGKRRRRGAATASSGFSMTSSAVYRNEGLTLLDQRFEQFDKTYDDDDMPSDPEDLIDSDPDEAPDLIAAREDFEAVMDDFLENYELVGRRMRPTLKGDTGIDKLDTIRRALGAVNIKDEEDYIEEDKKILMPIDVDEEKERWDCETILSTYSNLENHPRLIRARDTKSTPKIKLDPKTGLPIVALASIPTQKLKDLEEERDEESQDSDSTDRPSRTTIIRPRDESKEEKKARKMIVKQERQARRQDKKAKQELFSNERKQLVKTISQKGDVKMKRL
ncbi:hypothetical protein Clacol_003825 [Clathrus columnatus]|uniref:Protein LTV1 homolog n=1 Tax=Clathrus columnatus TaxID=1419009 RepID=A0AAV5A4T3_9AGAM|nr:hypothetical protein Clacol_003825 [Clathrus columnatus]